MNCDSSMKIRGIKTKSTKTFKLRIMNHKTSL
jgi:hypothetical protein